MSIYNLNLSDNFDQSRREALETYVIDRKPLGPMADLVEKQSAHRACEPCGSTSNSRVRPLRYLIRMPAEVKRAYDNPRSDYVDSQTLPAFLTWMTQNGYELMCTKYASHLDYGFWIKYDDDDDDNCCAVKKKTL